MFIICMYMQNYVHTHTHTHSTQFHVFEASRPLPRFSLYIPCPLSVKPQPESSVTFNLKERLESVSNSVAHAGVRRTFLFFLPLTDISEYLHCKTQLQCILRLSEHLRSWYTWEVFSVHVSEFVRISEIHLCQPFS